MRKLFLRLIILAVVISFVASFLLIGCKTTTTTVTTTAAETTAVSETTAAASETTATETTAAGPINIKFIMPSGPHNVRLKLIVEAFEKLHPNVTFDYEEAESQVLLDMTPSRIDAGEYFDIQFGWGGAANWNADFFTDKYCLDLTPYYKQYGWEDKLIDASKTYKTADGKYFLICNAGAIAQNIIYNKKIFKDIGIGEPKSPVSWEQFRDFSTKAKNAGYIPLTEGGANMYTCDEIWEMLLSRVAGLDAYNQYLHSSLSTYKGAITVKWTDDVVLESIKYLKELSTDFLQKGVLGTEMAEAQGLLTTTSQATMYGAANWEIPTMQKAAKDAGIELGYFVFPQIKDNVPPSVHIWIGNAWFVPKYVKKENIPTIMEFFDFFNQPENALKYAADAGVAPAIKSTMEQNVEAGFDPLVIESMSDIENYGGVDLFNSWLVPELQKEAIALSQGIIGGTLKTDAEILKELQKMEDIAVKYREGK